jgi:hypothetical protein
MEEPAVLTSTAVDAGNLESIPTSALRLGDILGCFFARFGCAALLVIAAALKAYHLFTDRTLAVYHGARWRQTALVEYELLLALWLLSGIGLQWGRRIALVTFLGFGCYAFYLGLSGKASCGCFGKVQVAPWWTFGIDAALVVLLSVWKPMRVRGDLELASGYVAFSARAFIVIIALFAVIGIPALLIGVRPAGLDMPIEGTLPNNRIVVLKPEKWIGKPFPLTEYIDMVEREQLSRGSWIIVFYHYDCPVCQQAIPAYERLAEQLQSAKKDTRIALIEILPYGPAALSSNFLCRPGRLNDSKEWFITTPTEVRITNGQVTAANSEVVPET